MKITFKDIETKDTLYVAYTGDEDVVPQRKEDVFVDETKYDVAKREFYISKKSPRLSCVIWIKKSILHI